MSSPSQTASDTVAPVEMPVAGAKPSAGRLSQLVMIVTVVIVLTAVSSHALTLWLGFDTSFGKHWVIGPEHRGHGVLVAGSSLAGDGLAWSRIGMSLGQRVEGWGI